MCKKCIGCCRVEIAQWLKHATREHYLAGSAPREWPNFAPETISLDFEQAMVAAVRTMLPLCRVQFCFFHLVKSMKKRIASEGLTQTYNNNAVFAEKSKMITSMAFLPVHHLRAGLNVLQTQLPQQLIGVFVWFMDNYTGRPWFNGGLTVPRFAPEERSVHQRTLDGGDRINNYAEAFHRKLQQAFDCTHPSVFHFINIIRCEQKSIDADISRCVAGEVPPLKKPKYRAADARILRLLQGYNTINNNPANQNDHNYHANVNVNPDNINHLLVGVSRNYEMRP